MAVVGGGFVGSEVFGELTAFMDEIVRYYRRVSRDEMRLFLIEAGERIMPEVPPVLAEYAARLLGRRAGVQILTNASVQSIESGSVHLKDQVIEAETIVLSAGILPAPVVAQLPLPKDRHGHLIVENTMRCKDRPEIWAIGTVPPSPIRRANHIPNWHNSRCGRRRRWRTIFTRFWRGNLRRRLNSRNWV